MPDPSQDQEVSSENRQIIEKLREAFLVSELRLNPEIEPATLFSPLPLQGEVS